MPTSRDPSNHPGFDRSGIYDPADPEINSRSEWMALGKAVLAILGFVALIGWIMA